MKFLDDGKLGDLTSELSDANLCGTNHRVINGRIEAYTMKRAGTDKKIAHALGERYLHEIEEVESEMAKFKKALGKDGGSHNIEENEDEKNEASRSSGGGTSSTSRRRRSQSVDIWTTSSTPNKGATSNGNNGVLKPSRRKRASSFDITNTRRQRLGLGINDKNDLRSSSSPSALGSSPPQNYFSNSPLGDFHEMGTRRLMTDLILTLNASFPDYDFSYVRPSHFVRLPSPTTAMNRTNEKLSEFAATTPSKGRGFLPKLWNAIDEVIVLSECEVYSYVPPTRDEDDDPLGFLSQSLAGDENAVGGDGFTSIGGNDGSEASTSRVTLWSFNYFFVNKSLKRIVFFTCVQTMNNEAALILDDEDYVDSIGVMDTGAARAGGEVGLDRVAGYISSPGSSFSAPIVEDFHPAAGGLSTSAVFAGTAPSASGLSGYYSLGGSSVAASDMTFDLDADAGAACSVAPPTVATT
uniref:Repressor of RNA polymerase III transcription n=2 Tax=Helicotheca tamesis TaxID=374047 RepID=A0A7S2MD34_9STRA|mmetsp:Transcript_13836/g.18933  ORF Transcript_13836/g.18933 Transcript_13836/m.18933 type:complete len:467 (+) Transcript_13836:246-1646(+)